MSGHASDYLHDKITWTRFLGYFAAFLVTFTVVDLFQVKESAQTDSFDKFNRYFANSYPHCIPRRLADIPGCILSWETSPETERVSSSKVSVVLWTDDMLVASRKSWPLRMEEHARVLETILPLQPRGVLVDLFFLDDPEDRGDNSLEDLIDVICDYHQAFEGGTGVRLYLIEPEPAIDSRTTTKLTEGLFDTCKLNLADSSNTGTVTFVSAALSDFPSHIYPKHGAAARMFSEDSGVEVDDFHIFWSHNPDQPFLDRQCETATAAFPTSIWNVFREISLPAIEAIPFLDNSGTHSHDATPCPYAPVISAHVLHCLRATPPSDTDGGWKEVEDCGLTKYEYLSIKQMLHRKYVMYGAEFHGIGDIYDVPIHDGFRLSGVFTHAMALDNLLETGGSVHSVNKAKGGVYYVLSAFIATVLFVLIRRVFFEYWPCVEGCLCKLPKRAGLLLKSIPLLKAKRRSRLKSFPGIDTLIKLMIVVWPVIWHFVLLIVEFVYWLCVVIVVGAVLVVLAWLVYLAAFLFEPFRFGILNWVGVLLVSGLLSAWVKMPFAEAVSEILRSLWEILHPFVRKLISSIMERLRGRSSTV